MSVDHRTLSDQILKKMTGHFHIMVGHDKQICHQPILSYVLQGDLLWKHFELDSHVPHVLHTVVEKKESQENGSRTNHQRESWWQHHSEETQNRITQTQEK